MVKGRGNGLAIAAVGIVSVLVLWGCPKKTEEAAMPESEMSETATAQESAAPSEAAESERAAAAAGGLEPIYFDFDQSFIRNDARSVMRANAEWLKTNPQVNVRIEGNCDARGTIEYNQALGQRRAAAAKKYLADLGISSGRITLVSYGKEKPVCTESTEDCWQQNRRGDFTEVR